MRKLLPVLLIFAFTSMIVGGCDPSGTGTVKVQDRSKIQDKLTKGARPDKTGKVDDDLGVKSRKKD